MKISIENFKNIKQVHEFEIKPMTILSGVNSSGKSSLIEMLLLIKQTLAHSSTTNVLSIDPKSYEVLTYQQDLINLMSFQLILNKTEIDIPKLFPNADSITVEVTYKLIHGEIKIAHFSIKIFTDENDAIWFINLDIQNDKNYNIKTSNPLVFVEENAVDLTGTVDFVAMIPQILTTSDGQKFQFKLHWVIDGISKIFQSIYYIGPARKQPKLSYPKNKTADDVGTKGELTAQILKEYEAKAVFYYSLNSKDKKEDTLLNAVNYWLCGEFGVSGKIFSEKGDEIYKIILEDANALKINIKNVGYGISQVLPIIVQGLLMPENSIFVVEQPEIHLHPKIQSLLYDFFYSLSLNGKKVIVETHSSHFITRMRRRVVEDENNEMFKKISLTFIEDDIFKTLELSDNGVLNYYPEDFIEPSNTELRAIVKAQARKMKKNG